MEVAIIISLIVFAVILFLIEMFIIPGISIAGIGGVIALAAAVFYAFNQNQQLGFIALAAGIVISAILVWIFFKSNTLDKMSLHAQIDSKVESKEKLQVNVGDKGVTISRLAPIGKVKVGGVVVEAKVEGGFLDENTPVEVVKVLNANVLVKAL